MGVNGLWKLLEPIGRPVTLESLENKTLAVDISVWLNQALYGMKDPHGNTLPNAHLVLLFQRICKLLFYKVKPIFVFDGGVPELKKKTLAARREMRLSAHHRARSISEKVLRKYIKSHVIGSVTGRGRRRTTTTLNEAEPERDLFELSPLPEEKEMKSSPEDESFFLEQNFQDIEGVNIDSQDFRELPAEVQHEIIVEMHEKSKRHSRYQAIDMPEESDDFSSFQLTNLLKRGKLTQRLGTIRKEMNERRAGELVVDVAQSGVEGNSIIQSQKIMSEESGHYILIKRPESSKPEDIEVEEDTLAGGFFREVHYNDHDRNPLVLKNLPRVSEKVAEASVSDLLDEKASTTDGGSSASHSFQDVADMSVLSPTWSDNSNLHVILEDKQQENDEIIQPTSAVDAGESNQTSEDLLGKINVNSKRHTAQDPECCDIKNSKIQGVNVQHAESNIKLTDSSLDYRAGTMAATNPDKLKTDSQEVIIEVTPRVNERLITTQENINVDETDDVFDDLEDEIKQKKMLIEKLLSNRNTSATGKISKAVNEKKPVLDGKPPGDICSDEAASQSSPIVSKQEGSFSTETNDEVMSMNLADDTLVRSPEPLSGVDNSRMPSEFDKALPYCTADSSVETRPAVKEFEGATYEDLEEMKARLDEDLDNLKEERSRQNRLAATVSDEMYKDSQELLQLFGIPFVVSPMEAEAQCATLNENNLCEGSITEDSDIMLFGGKKVYKNVFNQNKNAELYQEDDVKCVLGLDRLTLITIALLTGSDYTDGLQGIGIVSAMEIIQEFSGQGIDKLKNLKNWLAERKKCGNPSHESKLKSKLRNISLPVGFPSQQVFDAYLNPAVDDSMEAFSWANPDLHSLRLFAAEKLGWSKSKTDEILLPVLKRLNSSETQSKIDAFFPVQFNESRRIKSRRVKRVVNRLLNKDQGQEDDEKEKRKTSLNGRKRKKPQLHKKSSRSIDIESQRVSEQSIPKQKTSVTESDDHCGKLSGGANDALPPGLEENNGEKSSTDSTSDTSDDDTSYVPFRKVAVQPRRPGGRTKSAGSKRIGKRTLTTKK